MMELERGLGRRRQQRVAQANPHQKKVYAFMGGKGRKSDLAGNRTVEDDVVDLVDSTNSFPSVRGRRHRVPSITCLAVGHRAQLALKRSRWETSETGR